MQVFHQWEFHTQVQSRTLHLSLLLELVVTNGTRLLLYLHSIEKNSNLQGITHETQNIHGSMCCGHTTQVCKRTLHKLLRQTDTKSGARWATTMFVWVGGIHKGGFNVIVGAKFLVKAKMSLLLYYCEVLVLVKMTPSFMTIVTIKVDGSN